LKPEKVEEILAETGRVWVQIGLLLNIARLTHDQGIQLFRAVMKQGGPLAVEIIMSRAVQAIPDRWLKYIPTGDKLDTELERVSTRKKWKMILESSDAKSDEVHEIVKMIRQALPKTKKDLQKLISKLPGGTGGKEPKLNFEQREEIRKTIRKRRGPRVKLKHLYASLAPLYGVEAITIKRIWLSDEADTEDG
jgi:hypothetical protein